MLVVYYVVCFFPVLLLRVGSDNVAFVRTCSTMPVCFLHGLVSFSLRDFRQDDHTLEITSIFALLDARSFAMPMLRYIPLAYHASYFVEPNL